MHCKSKEPIFDYLTIFDQNQLRFMRYFYFLCLLGFSLQVSAQAYVHQVIFLNEGRYDFALDTLVVPPSLGVYHPLTETYEVVDVIPDAEFASDVLVDDVIYVAADNQLITYDKNTLERLQTVTIPGIRELAVYKDELLVTRGDYLVFFDSYFQVYDKHSLELLYALDTTDGPAYATEGIVIRDDKAYVAINNGFVFGEEVGLIGVVDLKTHDYLNEIDLGPAGINPDNIMLDEHMIYTLNNKNYLSSSISVIDPETAFVTTHDMIAANSGCGTSTFADEHIYFMEYGVDKLARFDVQSGQIVDTLAETGAYYGLIDDQINGHLIGTWTDFLSQGTAYILSYDGKVLKSFDVGISPGSIALDVRMVTGVTDVTDDLHVIIRPNPVSDFVEITAESQIRDVTLFNAQGAQVVRQFVNAQNGRVVVSGYPDGLYIARVSLVSGENRTLKVVKQ